MTMRTDGLAQVPYPIGTTHYSMADFSWYRFSAHRWSVWRRRAGWTQLGKEFSTRDFRMMRIAEKPLTGKQASIETGWEKISFEDAEKLHEAIPALEKIAKSLFKDTYIRHITHDGPLHFELRGLFVKGGEWHAANIEIPYRVLISSYERGDLHELVAVGN